MDYAHGGKPNSPDPTRAPLRDARSPLVAEALAGRLRQRRPRAFFYRVA
jgi:hypothetical protein